MTSSPPNSTDVNVQKPQFKEVDLSSPPINPPTIYWDVDTKDQHELNTSKRPWWTRYLIEPAVFIYIFAYAIVPNPTTNLFMDRACTLELNYSAEVCKNLFNNTDAMDKSQIFASNYNLYLNLIKVAPSAVLSVFIGPWSDKYGRKQQVYVSLLGTIVSDLGMIVYSLSPNAPLYQTLLYAIPQGFSGGIISVLASMYTMVTDSTKEEYRTVKYTILELCFGMGFLLGTLASGYIFDQFGYMPVFSVALGCHLIMMVYVFIVIKDESFKKQATMQEKFSDFFSCENFKENFRTALKNRENYGRVQIWTLSISISIIVLGYLSVNDILFLYCKKMYQWDMTYFSVVSTVSSAANSVFMVVAVLVMIKWWKVPDHWIGLMGLISMLAQAVTRTFSYSPFIYYIAAGVGVFGSIAPLAVRSKLSKAVGKEEIGKLFSVVATMEFFIPIPGSVLYTQAYNAILGFYPGLVFLIGGSTLIFPLLVFLWLVRLAYSTKKSDQEYLINDDTNQLPNELKT